MIENDIDSSGFYCINYLAIHEYNLILQYSNLIKLLLLQKLSLPLQKTERFLLMRDNCISALATWTMNIFNINEINFDELIPLALAAMPIQLDFNENSNVLDFFIWLYEKVNNNYIDQFLRVLVVLFSNHSSIIDLMNIPNQKLIELKKILIEIIEITPNYLNLINTFLDNDEQKLFYLQNNLNNN